jgi:hypothetical protein
VEGPGHTPQSHGRGERRNARHGARFEQEARAIAALNHPHICQIFDIGPDYLVLEFIEGQPLLSQARPGPLAVEEAGADGGSAGCGAPQGRGAQGSETRC